jgi:hypothetical protein
MKAAVAAASSMSSDKVTITSAVFKVSITLTFPSGGASADQAKTAVADANSVAASKVTVTAAARRLSGSERKLSSVAYNVEIVSDDASAAQSIKTSASDMTALQTALTTAGATSTSVTASPPVASVTVVTEVEVPSGDQDTVRSALQSGIADQITAQIPGSSTAAPTITVTTPSPTAAPAPPPPGTTSAASFYDRQVAKVLFSVFAIVATLQ